MKREFQEQLPKKFVISVISVAKLKNVVVFAFTYVLKGFALFIWRFLYVFI
jgi:hypothetical protein